MSGHAIGTVGTTTHDHRAKVDARWLCHEHAQTQRDSAFAIAMRDDEMQRERDEMQREIDDYRNKARRLRALLAKVTACPKVQHAIGPALSAEVDAALDETEGI